jgi:hypothetical protein
MYCARDVLLYVFQYCTRYGPEVPLFLIFLLLYIEDNAGHTDTYPESFRELFCHAPFSHLLSRSHKGTFVSNASSCVLMIIVERSAHGGKMKRAFHPTHPEIRSHRR